MRFSTPRITPDEVEMPIAVEPSLIASREYSTWNRRPSGEKVLLVVKRWSAVDWICQGSVIGTLRT